MTTDRYEDFLVVSKQEIESLCIIFRHLTRAGDKGKKPAMNFFLKIGLIPRKTRSKSFS